MAEPITPTNLSPTQMIIDPTTGGLPSFIQMEQKKDDDKAAEAFSKGVSAKDKDGFASLIPKAYLMEANEADAETKMTSSTSEFGKYLADIAMKAGIEQGLAKAISSASNFNQLKAIFGNGSSWESSSDSDVSSAASSVKNGINQKIQEDADNPSNGSYVDSQRQSIYFGVSQQATVLNNQAQVKLTIKNNLDKMASSMQGDSDSISSLVGNLAMHPV